MNVTFIEWLVGVAFLAALLLLIAARIHVARRNCAALRDAHWLTGTVGPGVVHSGCTDTATGCDSGAS